MSFDFSQLRSFTEGDRSFFTGLAEQTRWQDCEIAFANLLMWQSVYDEAFFVADGRAVVVERRNGLLHFPIGEMPDLAYLRALSAAARAAGFRGDYYDAPPEVLRQIPEIGDFYEIVEDEDAFDYLYDLEQLEQLSGPLLRKKRNLVRQFERNVPDFQVHPITVENLDAVVVFAKELNAKLHQADFLAEENEAMETMAQFFVPAGLGGILLTDGSGTPLGFSVWSLIGNGVWDIHFEKADHAVKGAPQMLVVQLAAALRKLGGTRMNREQDMGEPGLRQAKRSLDPCGMYRRIYLREKC